MLVASITAVLIVLRFAAPAPLPGGGPDQLVPVLIALGLLCTVGLAWRDHSSVAWLATIGAAFSVTIDIASLAAEARPDLSEDGWRAMGTLVSLSALVAIGAAAAYATSRPRLRRPWLVVPAGAVVLGASVLAGWAVANPADSAFVGGSAMGSLGLVTRSFIALTAASTAIGIVGDALPAAERAARRSALTRGASSRTAIVSWIRAFSDELSPGRRRARLAVLAERSRVARDIHADVVPGLRHVLTQAQGGATAEQLAASLRDVLADVEAVGESQHPIQLEIGGLIPALEWLAERVERRSDATVTLEIDEPSAESHDDPPPDIAATAFRIAALALGNVARHAPGSEAVVRVSKTRAFVHLTVSDDGPGISDEALTAARLRGRRGIADMVSEASSCDGVVEVARGPGGTGTRVLFRWRAAAGR